MSSHRINGFVPGRAVLLLGFCLSLGSSVAAGTPLISPVSQDRYVESYADVVAGSSSDTDTDRDAATDFGPFEATASVYVTTSSSGNSATVSSGANQSSWIGDYLIQAFGHMGYWVNTSGSVSGASVRATSMANVTFMLNEESAYALQGSLNGGAGLSEFTLTGPEGVVHEISAFGGHILVQESGTLPAGEYTFEALTHGEIGAVGPNELLDGGSAYEMTLRFSLEGFAGPGGEVPDGMDGLGGAPLQVMRVPPDYIELSWSPSCRVGDTGYAVYEGVLGDPLSLTPVHCRIGGNFSYRFEHAGDAAWFIVVPVGVETEGSYGKTSDGIERQPASIACLPQQLGDPVCP